VFRSALNLSKLTTRRGAKIEVHFEDISTKTLLEQQYSHSEFLRKVNKDIDQWGSDNGKDTVHLLINNQGKVALTTETGYAKWQATPEEDWFHSEIHVVLLNELFKDLMEELFLHPLKNNPRFVGMPEKEFDEFIKDPENLKKMETILAADHRCNLCPLPCPGRGESFDKLAFEQAIAAI